MGRFRALFRKLWPGSFEHHRTEADKAHDRSWDSRTNDIVDGKGLSATGKVMDFESDSRRR
jgi:hypothetical protein